MQTSFKVKRDLIPLDLEFTYVITYEVRKTLYSPIQGPNTRVMCDFFHAQHGVDMCSFHTYIYENNTG